MADYKNFRIKVTDKESGAIKRLFEYHHVTKNRFQMELGRLHNHRILSDQGFKDGMVEIEEF